jgi:hypothetical protein
VISLNGTDRYAWLGYRKEKEFVMASTNPGPQTDEAAIRELIARWAKAVRDEDLAGIRANHDPEILVFDVPPPLMSRGLDA